MTNILRFGKLETVTITGDEAVTDIKTYHNYEVVKKLQATTNNVVATDRKILLTEVLKLMDQLEVDTVEGVSLECEKRSTGKYHLKLTTVHKII